MGEKRILIVDDEAAILQVLATLLKSEGYMARCTSRAAEALEIVAQEDIKLCLLDLRMPNMDGMELCSEIKKIRPDLEIFALSAYVDAVPEEELEKNGFSKSFTKPFKVTELMAACAESIGGDAPPAPGDSSE